jgi:hypothetical protein
MRDVLAAIKDTPLPTLLVLAGLFFILLALVQSLSGRIQVEPGQRRASLAIGGVLAALGVGLHLAHDRPSPRAEDPAAEVRFSQEPGMDRFGADYRHVELQAPTPPACEQFCRQDSACKAYTYVPPGMQAPLARCYLKHLVPPATPLAGVVSGVRMP